MQRAGVPINLEHLKKTTLLYIATKKTLQCPIMPSAHGLIFCRKQFREKIGVKIRFFIRLSQRTRIDFLSQTKHRTYLTIFFRVSFGTHCLIFYPKYCVVTIAGEAPLLDYVTPIFYWNKSHRTRGDFHSIVLPAIKKQSVCAGHKSLYM